MKKQIEQIRLSDLREGETAGREKQSPDMKLVHSYVECKRAGAEFPPIKTTKDRVIFAGLHRYEMYKLFYKDEDALIAVEVYDIPWDDATEEERQKVRDMGFADNWHPETGKPIEFSGVKRNVEQHVGLDEPDSQIMSTLGPTYGVKLVRRAINIVRGALAQEAMNYARRLVSNGMPPTKARDKVGLPANTDLELLKAARNKQPRVRNQHITKAGTSCQNKWQYQLEQATDLFNAQSISQEALLSVVDTMDRAAATLQRSAARSRRLTLEVIAEKAKRLRHGTGAGA
jgi:hypothetical protein